ncbi:basic leucine zipper and W2 domain-containing protein 2-like [Chiloscyllium plagiosum]|uniref:basic leucine zipper and W2 domain-containing protein 2-like n=1 Tax=Chiloscyllium plagiosum TaxID=36176 RepID=UPI001CB87D8D|nr:basic leucine zipper and W2 domain-containing protein 2-like [Chiloscyllium plagiosum]
MSKLQKPVLTGQRFKTRKRDEKEKFEPTVFRDTIIQGLNEAGNDLEAVSKFLDVTGSRLDYRRYADTLFDILIAGSMLGKYGFNFRKVVLTFFGPFKTGISASFAVKVFKAWMAEKDANAVTSSLKKSNLDKRLLELFPANKQNFEHFATYFTNAGLKELSDFLRVQQSLGTRKELQKELKEKLSQECPIREIVLYVKDEMKRNDLPEQAVIGLLWTCVMNAVEWNKKEELVTEQALKHLKQYAPLLAVFSTQGQSELTLLQKIQEYCYDNIHFMKAFQKIIVLFYKADVLSEEAILKWYKEAHVPKGKSMFLEQMKKFVEWLQNAEEESESAEGEDD